MSFSVCDFLLGNFTVVGGCCHICTRSLSPNSCCQSWTQWSHVTGIHASFDSSKTSTFHNQLLPFCYRWSRLSA